MRFARRTNLWCAKLNLVEDHLGSTRMLTDSNGSGVRRYDYLPFGQELSAGAGGRTTAMGYLSAPDGTSPKFTGQDRDAETGSDDWFQVRYMDGAQGRFQSVDPGNAGANLMNPQTWNGYSYVGNNPLSATDPSGMFTCATCVAATTGNPVAIGIGAAIDVGSILVGLLGFGGGGPPPTIPPGLALPSSPVIGSGQGGGYGSGNSSPMVFNAMGASGSWGAPTMWDKFLGFIAPPPHILSPGEIRTIKNTPVSYGIVFDGPPATQMYRALSTAGDVIYVGITRRMAARTAEHSGRFVIRAIEDLPSLSSADARGVEQALIEYYKLGKNGGTLLNKINSIATTNPAYAAQLRKGIAVLKGIGYPGF